MSLPLPCTVLHFDRFARIHNLANLQTMQYHAGDMPNPESTISEVLAEWREGDHQALARLMPLVLSDLREIARRHLSKEARSITLQPTALVNEVYLRLAGKRSVNWRNSNHFFGEMVLMVRRILVDHARSRLRHKRGGKIQKISLGEVHNIPDLPGRDLIELDCALNKLIKLDERQARIVQLRFFIGLTTEEIAKLLGISSRTVKREWRVARMWLHKELASSTERAEGSDPDER